MKFSYNTNYFPPAPSVEIWLGIPEQALEVGPLLALVDTGADASIIPIHHIELLKIQVDNRKYLRSQWGERRLVDTYLLDVAIGQMRLPLIEIIADELGDEVILGRNILNKLIATLDGPRQILKLSG